jgi:Molybdopterin-binding domain of aldehyde dehydrogenase
LRTCRRGDRLAYAYKHGLRVTFLRIGNFGDAPLDHRGLAIWLKPEGFVQPVRIGLEHPDFRFEIFFGASDNERAWWDNEPGVPLWLPGAERFGWERRPLAPRVRCATGTDCWSSSIRAWWRSQLYGGMIWGVSFALHEQAVMDPRSGRPMNVNLAEYHIPVNADVPSLEAILIEEHDAYVNGSIPASDAILLRVMWR